MENELVGNIPFWANFVYASRLLLLVSVMAIIDMFFKMTYNFSFPKLILVMLFYHSHRKKEKVTKEN